MLRLNRLGLKTMGLMVLAGALVLMTGCCNQCRQSCGGCSWPNIGLETGIFPTCQSKANCCNPCQNYNPCHPFGNTVSNQARGASSAGADWGYADSNYLSSAN